jgi:ubiquinol-cytochrome c reductase cytochrome b subunit
VAHLCRIFFTGAFRKPREVNWLIGVGLLTLALGEGFTGYSLPDDLLSTTGLRIAYGVAESIPLVGTYVSFFLFGGEFPGPDIIPRLYVIHILLIPGILLALITAHMLIMWHQKHTQWAGKHRTNENVVGSPFYPNFMAKTGGFFFMVFAVLALLGGLVQINPVWLWGPYNPAQISAGSQPDWYIGFLEGSLRIMPNLETNILGHTISWNILIPGVIIPGAMFTALAIYPFLEAWVTGDRREHHLCDRPRNRPGRTGIGVMALTFYGILLAAGGNDLIADKFDIQLFATTWFFRGAIIVLPPIAFWVTRRICLGLQRRDMHTAAHGFETGRIIRLPSGEYIEVEAPLSEERLLSLDIANQSTPPPALPPATDARGVPNPSQRGPLNRFRRSMMGILYESRDGEVEHEPEEQPKSITRE